MVKKLPVITCLSVLSSVQSPVISWLRSNINVVSQTHSNITITLRFRKRSRTSNFCWVIWFSLFKCHNLQMGNEIWSINFGSSWKHTKLNSIKSIFKIVIILKKLSEFYFLDTQIIITWKCTFQMCTFANHCCGKICCGENKEGV